MAGFEKTKHGHIESHSWPSIYIAFLGFGSPVALATALTGAAWSPVAQPALGLPAPAPQAPPAGHLVLPADSLGGGMAWTAGDRVAEFPEPKS